MKLNKNVIKVVCFGLIFCVLFLNVQAIFQPKWENDGQSFYRTRSFYENKDMLDVVFVGSSHVHCTINPLLLFQEYGFTSYDFSTAGQDLSTSLLFINEAIKNKKPKAIVMDSYGLCYYNISESQHRKSMDPLPLSLEKVVQINYLAKRNENLNIQTEFAPLSAYLFPILRYHDRWKELSKSDYVRKNDITYLHGYVPHYNSIYPDFSEYHDEVKLKGTIIIEQKQLLKKLVDICEENNVKLMLTKSPSPLWRDDYHQLVAEWADEYDIPFIDYNLLIDELGINLETDFNDKNSHVNDFGATKVSLHLGQYLKEQYDLPDHRGEDAYQPWNDDWQMYQQDKAAYFLSHETEWQSYLEKLQNENYTIYISAKDNIGGGKYPELVEKLHMLGIKEDINDKGRWAYQAVIDNGQLLYEKLADEPLSYKTEINGQKVELISKGYENGNCASIRLNQEEYFVDHRGVGIVVYDNLLNKVVDSVTFDLYDGGKAYRN